MFAHLEAEFGLKDEQPTLKQVTDPAFRGNRYLTGKWSKMQPSILAQEAQPTGVALAKAKEFALASVTLPPGFAVHPRLEKFFIEERRGEVAKDKLSWATCEAVALFSLLAEGYGVRMTGQDVERGTFSQRHARLIDNQTEQEYSPLSEFAHQHQTRAEVRNSPLSENSVLSFEYGYALESPNNLVIWEAQFGDFYNTAQVVVDTFITNSEAKWLRQNALVAILPHGYDGAGPEHTSCRIERFLLLANSQGSHPQRHFKHNDLVYPPKQDEFV